ncbi:MAG: VOC family protein [Chloroflexaceae bacterium]|jgi:catechol 2,3-dioxygenase|nr:VOC family protein [Chloroflexaceae bacterium]
MHESIHPQTTIGHVHLKVADLERAVRFYTEVLGFEVMLRLGSSAAFLSAGGYHHHIGLNTWESAGGPPPAPGTTGLYHFAILLPSRKELARTLQRLLAHNWPIDGASDHGVSEAIYFRDPDGNGIEIYRDRPREEWPTDDQGQFTMGNHPLDVAGLMGEVAK